MRSDRRAIRVSWVPESEDEQRLCGNLIVLRSPDLGEQCGPRPGPWPSYTGGIETLREVVLTPGEQQRVQVPSGEGRIAGYLDVRREFMQHFGVGEGGYYSSVSVEIEGAGGADSVLRLDRRVEMSRPETPEWVCEGQVRVEGGTGSAEIPLIVGLPPGYEAGDERYPVIYLFHGFSGSRFSVMPQMKLFRDQMERTGQGMILVSAEQNGRFGPHLFVDSEANGPMRDRFLHGVLPWVDWNFRTRAEASARVTYGHSSGGWTALALAVQEPGAIGAAFCTSTDPIRLESYWQVQPGQVYVDCEGREQSFVSGPGVPEISMRRFVDGEVRTGSFGQFAAWLSAFSPYVPEREPFPFALPFDLDSGSVLPGGWKAWQQADLYEYTSRLGPEGLRRLQGRIHLYVGSRDEFQLAASVGEYSQLLTRLGVEHRFELIDGTHFSFPDAESFMRRLFDCAVRISSAPIRRS